MPNPPRIVDRHRELFMENERDFKKINASKDKLHEYRMCKIRENLEAEQKKAWIYVGNNFRDPPLWSKK